ncbi:TrmH family RNA methyltransferase [Rhodoferax sp.]|uniref:TrmH family RNA methyltransferase n=1 Tax=Rhodoferax sp. TaxID=50421 RepID=UPI00275817BE|nr:RNA methyltransferase [Rhodoferax sp.]
MTETGPVHIRSRDNAWLKDLRRLTQDSNAYRKQGRVWLEGDHLCRAALQRGVQPQVAVFAESYFATALAQWAHGASKVVVVEDRLFADISALGSPAQVGFVLELASLSPELACIERHGASVILDRVQDAGNVGSILRSASAFGFKQVLALKGTAALWSPKVLRAGMGAHFGLQLFEGLDVGELDRLDVPLITTSSHQGAFLHRHSLPMPCAWALGHEGQGVSEAVAARSALKVRIAQPGGEESLNVAAAAAICLHASSVAVPTPGP